MMGPSARLSSEQWEWALEHDATLAKLARLL